MRVACAAKDFKEGVIRFLVEKELKWGEKFGGVRWKSVNDKDS